MDKLIIYAAIGHPSEENAEFPAMPRSYQHLVEIAHECHTAGATIVHYHGAHDDKGRLIPDAWGKVAEDIKKHCDILIDFGQAGAPLDQRKPLMTLTGKAKPDFMAVSLTGHDYRRKSKARGEFDVYYEHHRDELEEYARSLIAAGVKPAWELWHNGALWNLEYLTKKGLLEKDQPLWLNLFFGTPGSVWSPPTIDEVNHRINCLPQGAPYLLAPRGTAGPIGQTRLLTLGIMRGGHVRLGTQDLAHYTDGVPAKSNAQIMERIARISRDLGREIASTDETRKILGLPARKK
jgi:3-keto-5-aminohexanoate cleavage enzyme